MSRIKRDKRSEKRHGRAADAPRRSSRRKHQQKKLECKLKIVRFLCTICSNTLNDKKFVLLCNHSFHLKCIQRWLENDPRNCPICRRGVSPNTGLYQLPRPAVQRLYLVVQRLIVSTRRRIPEALSGIDDSRHPPEQPQTIQDQVNPRDSATSSLDLAIVNIDSDDQSSHLDNSNTLSINSSLNFRDSSTDLPASSPPNLDNRNVNLDDQSSHLGNSSTHSVDPTSVTELRIPYVFLPILMGNMHLDDQSSHLDNSNTNSVDPPSNFSDSRIDLPASSPPNLDNRNVNLDDPTSHLDNSGTHSDDSSSNFCDSRRDLAHTTDNSDNPER